MADWGRVMGENTRKRAQTRATGAIAPGSLFARDLDEISGDNHQPRP
jgi:hypothetical protein